ncbi:MAG: GNAT family N-acetyltransferase [Pseudomonadota bacterium]
MPALPPGLLCRVEDAGLNASAPPQQRWLDGWLLRLSPGKAKRARCVNALASGRLSLDERLAQARQAYAAAGLPLLVRITPFSVPAELDQRLAELGFHTLDDTRVMVCPSLDALQAPRMPEAAELLPTEGAQFAELVGGWRGSSAAQQRAHAERLAQSPVRYAGFRLLVDGETVACAQMAREGALVGLYDVFTAPEHRGRGHAGAICAALLSSARKQGAQVGYLQVEGDNHSARAVYHRLGFADAYAYHYRTDDPQAK